MIRYTRPSPSPFRSERNLRVPRSMFFASGENMPSPVGVSSSSSPKTATEITVPGQLSVADADSPTLIRSWFAGQSVVVETLHVTTGAWVSLTVTVKVQFADIFPDASVALQVTVVGPTGKNDPDAGVQLEVTPGQLSLGVGANVTIAPH